MKKTLRGNFSFSLLIFNLNSRKAKVLESSKKLLSLNYQALLLSFQQTFQTSPLFRLQKFKPNLNEILQKVQLNLTIHESWVENSLMFTNLVRRSFER